MLRKNVKKPFLAILLLFVFTQFAANAQVTQTEGPITVTIESAKVIGDQYLVIGKVSVSKKARLMISQYTTATNNSGETLNAKKI